MKVVFEHVRIMLVRGLRVARLLLGGLVGMMGPERE